MFVLCVVHMHQACIATSNYNNIIIRIVFVCIPGVHHSNHSKGSYQKSVMYMHLVVWEGRTLGDSVVPACMATRL